MHSSHPLHSSQSRFVQFSSLASLIITHYRSIMFYIMHSSIFISLCRSASHSVSFCGPRAISAPGTFPNHHHTTYIQYLLRVFLSCISQPTYIIHSSLSPSSRFVCLISFIIRLVHSSLCHTIYTLLIQLPLHNFVFSAADCPREAKHNLSQNSYQ